MLCLGIERKKETNENRNQFGRVNWARVKSFFFGGTCFWPPARAMCFVLCVSVWVRMGSKAIELPWPKPNRNRYFLWLESHSHSRKNKLSWIDHIRFDGALHADLIRELCRLVRICVVYRENRFHSFRFVSFLFGFLACIRAYVCLEHT